MDGLPLAVFRCDASPAIGAGHIMRCLALAETLADAGWRIVFATGGETRATIPALAAAGLDIAVLADEGDETDQLARRFAAGADLLVVDHYGRAAPFERGCRSWARKILVLDDATGRDHDCDWLLDSAAADAASYRDHIPPHATILAGPGFAQVRPSFLARRGAAMARRDGRRVKTILVSLGATDPANATCLAIDALESVIGEAAVTVVLSSRAPHLEEVRRRTGPKVSLVTDVGDMAELMAQADLAVGAAGASAFERAVLGLPTILVTLAENQRGVCKLLAQAGAATEAGDLAGEFVSRLRALVSGLLQDAAARTNMARAANLLVDGRGTQRVMIALAGDIAARGGARVRFRLADTGDEGWLLELQQAPGTRRHFRNPAVPDVDEHRSWMRHTLDDGGALLLIAEADGRKAGMARLDRVPNHGGIPRYVTSIAVDPAQYNRGIGSAALLLVRRMLPGAILDADIMPENANSKRLFTAAGFRPVGGDLYRSRPLTGPAAGSLPANVRRISWAL